MFLYFDWLKSTDEPITEHRHTNQYTLVTLDGWSIHNTLILQETVAGKSKVKLYMNIHQRFGSVKLIKNAIFIVTFGSDFIYNKISKVVCVGGISNILCFYTYQN